MPERARLYFDNAATSFPKPHAVYDAVDRYNREIGAPVGRGSHQQAVEVQRVVERCRKRAADLFQAVDLNHVLFTFNGTDSLNIAIHGTLAEGDHVVTSELEHNSVLRPLKELERRKRIEITRIAPDENGRIDPAAVREAIRPNTKLVTVLHASNVTGRVQPVAEIGEIVCDTGALFLVDAAQTAGHIPVDMKGMSIDLLACSGHKGLLGPLGTGLLILHPGVQEQVRTLRQGGTGSNSEQDQQPETPPDKFESGNHNAPGLFGLEAALAWIQEQGINTIHKQEQTLAASLIDQLSAIDGLIVHCPGLPEERVGVVSVSVPGFEPQEVASILDENFRIQTRAGLHCAPGAHRRLGTIRTGGTVRLSIGPFTTSNDVDAVTAALGEITDSA